MGIFITAYQKRTSNERITFLNTSGAAATLGANDVVRIKIGRANMPQQAPLLDITSTAPTGNGSSVTKVNPVNLKLTGVDLSPDVILPGTYDIEACVVDSGDSNRIKLAEEGVFVLHPTQAGGVA